MAFNLSSVRVDGDANNRVGRDQYTAGRDQYVYNVAPLNYKDLDAALRLLSERAAVNAFYDAEQRFPQPNCHPGTRTEILEKLSKWIEGNWRNNPAFWLFGTVGVGKSAIAQNLSERYFGSRVAATFFFSRNDAARDKLDPLVASIIYQFLKTPALWAVLGPRILETIRLDPRIFDTAFENQFQKLIVDPCSEIEHSLWERLPNVIIVDGLDECVEHPSQERLLRIIRTTIREGPVPWKFLICSRPEPHIRDGFSDFGAVLDYFDVNSSNRANQDIKEYFLYHFSELRKRLRSLRHEDPSWPSEPTIDQLVARAQGQFIFAVTVIKYTNTRDERPQDRLLDVLRIRVQDGINSPYAMLDLLYHHILSKCPKWMKVQPVLRLLLTHDLHHHPLLREFRWHSPRIIESLLKLDKGEASALLSRLHSVLYFPEDDNSDIHFAHASITEFLSDPNRSADYYTPSMSQKQYFECVAALLLRTVSLLTPFYPPSQPRPFTTALPLWISTLQNHWDKLMQVSFRYWYQYCIRVDTPTLDLLTTINRLDPCCLLAASLYYNLPPLHSMTWQAVVSWAERFGEHTEDFVQIANSYLKGYSIAYPSDVPKQEALWRTLEMLASFGYLTRRPLYDLLVPPPTLNGGMDKEMALFYCALYGLDRNNVHRRSAAVMILLGDRDSYTPPSEDWITVGLEKEDADVMQKVLRLLWLHPSYKQLLLDDIEHDSHRSVSGLFKTDDLTRLKLLRKKYWEVFLYGVDVRNMAGSGPYQSEMLPSPYCSVIPIRRLLHFPLSRIIRCCEQKRDVHEAVMASERAAPTPYIYRQNIQREHESSRPLRIGIGRPEISGPYDPVTTMQSHSSLISYVTESS